MNATHLIHPLAGSAPVLRVPAAADADEPIPLPAPLHYPAYGRRRNDLITRGAVMSALRCQVERIELVAPTMPDQHELARLALSLLTQVMNDAEPGLGDRVRAVLG